MDTPKVFQPIAAGTICDWCIASINHFTRQLQVTPCETHMHLSFRCEPYGKELQVSAHLRLNAMALAFRINAASYVLCSPRL